MNIPFDQAKFDAVKAEIDMGVDTAATLAGTVAPQYIPFIVLGQAVAKALPGLYEDVVKLVNQTEPGDADNAALAAKIAALQHPEAL